MSPIRRALLSVSDKTGLVDLARGLAELGVELLSTGGTARALSAAGLAVREVADVTGFPEMLDGRVKTLHPAIHGGILARRDLAAHEEALARHGIGPIDLVAVNLYPFEATVAKPGVGFEDAIEQIDVGGPAMIRARREEPRGGRGAGRSCPVRADPGGVAPVGRYRVGGHAPAAGARGRSGGRPSTTRRSPPGSELPRLRRFPPPVTRSAFPR